MLIYIQSKKYDKILMVKYTDTTNIYSSSSKTKAQDCVCNGLGYCSMFNYLWLNLNKVSMGQICLIFGVKDRT